MEYRQINPTSDNHLFVGKLVEVELQQDPNLTPSQLYEEIKTANPAPPGLEAVLNGRDRKQMVYFTWYKTNSGQQRMPFTI
uniref:Uncharacterized protein n=1 Tax=Romanomermis culicivorax TaxID=13658 RepID=A0A915J250_ROMCU